jgi:hypothetical protein
MIIKMRRTENDKKGNERESDTRLSASVVEPLSVCLHLQTIVLKIFFFKCILQPILSTQI